MIIISYIEFLRFDFNWLFDYHWFIYIKQEWFKGVSQASKNQSDLLIWHNIKMHFNKAVMALFITSIYVYFCVSEVDLDEGQSGFRPLYSTHFRKF